MLFLLAAPLCFAADAAAPANSQANGLDLFEAMAAGQIKAEVFPKDSTSCTVLLTNIDKTPLSIRMPAALAAVPVLGQFAQPFPPPQVNNNRRTNQQQPQPLALSNPWNRQINNNNMPNNNIFNNNVFNNNNNRNRNNRGPFGPFFNIAPEQVVKLKLPAMCLQYGWPTPQPRMKYELKPLEDVTTTPGVAEVAYALGNGEATQMVAQLAAWHLNNEMSWDTLAKKKERGTFGQVPTYHAADLKAAKKLAEKAVEKAKAKPEVSETAAK